MLDMDNSNIIQSAVFISGFHLLSEKTNQPTCPVGKSHCPLNLITGCAIHGSKNWHQAFGITHNESFTSLWRNFGPLFLAELFQYEWSV